jgi:hypothetical protein
MVAKLVVVLFLAFAVTGCASPPSYSEQVRSRPLPITSSTVDSECRWIRSEIARMESLRHATATSDFHLMFAAQTRQNIAELEARAARVGCRAAFSDTGPHLEQSSKIEQCIAACRANTSRTSEQCFESCNR